MLVQVVGTGAFRSTRPAVHASRAAGVASGESRIVVLLGGANDFAESGGSETAFAPRGSKSSNLHSAIFRLLKVNDLLAGGRDACA